MFYLGIDQHAKQLTVNLRDGSGDVISDDMSARNLRKYSSFPKDLHGGVLRIIVAFGRLSKSVVLKIGYWRR